MTTYIAFLRAINVGGKNIISMAELRKMLESMGYTNVQTLLQSGNVLFQGDKAKSADIETRLEQQTAKRFGLTIDYIVLTDKELADAIKSNPFGKFAKADPGRMLVLFLKSAAPKEAEKALSQAIKGREVIAVKGNVVYAQYPDGVGTSKLTNAVLEKHLTCRATGRNWNTVTKLMQMADAL